MFGLPVEAISMIASTAMGGMMKMWGQAQADKADQHRMLIQRNEQFEESVDNARQMQNPNSAWIRRFLAVTAMFAGVGIVYLAPLLGISTNVPIEVTNGFKFLFLDFTSTQLEYIKMDGFVTPEWLPVAIMNILGFYFGSSAMKR